MQLITEHQLKITEELLAKYQNCETTALEESEILKWLSSSAEHRKEMDKLDFLFNASILTAPFSNTEEKKTPVVRKRVWRAVCTCVSACAAVVATFFIGNMLVPDIIQRNDPAALTQIDVPLGQRVDITLHDGTVVCLNSGSHLEYPAMFHGGSRTVRLSGEAMFDVAKDPDHPFIVETFACRVQALGTRFDVIADESRQIFSSSLLEGKILVSSIENDSQVILCPGEKVELTSGMLARSLIQANDDFLWTRGIISLDGLSFSELMERFESIYGYRVIYQTNSVPNICCRGKIRISDGIVHAMEALKLTGTKFNYEINYNLHEIYIR